MVLGSSPVTVTSPSDFAPASSKEFLDIQATVECGFTLKRVRDMTRTYSPKYQYLINKRQGVGINHFNDPEAFIEYSNDMHDVYKNVDECNPDKENKILIVFDDMIANMIHNKKLISIVAKLYIRGRKLSISLILLLNRILRFQRMIC